MTMTMAHSPKLYHRLAVKASSWNPTQKEWKLAAECVQIEEKDRIGKFIFKRDAKTAMVGRLLMRYAISRILNAPYRCLRFDRTDKGKPILLSPVDKMTPRCDINFNLSHQGDYVVFAADKTRLIGVDVMKIEWTRKSPMTELFRLMDRQLTEDEWTLVRKDSHDMSQLKKFYRFWCLKESLVKALGTGIGFEVGRLNFNLPSSELDTSHIETGTKVDIDNVPSPDWAFEETMLEDHCVGVALKSNTQVATETDTTGMDIDTNTEPPIPFTIVDIKELLSGCEPLTGSSPDQEYWELFSSRQENPEHR